MTNRLNDLAAQWATGAAMLFCGALFAIMVGGALWFGFMLLAGLLDRSEAWAGEMLKLSAVVWLPLIAGGMSRAWLRRAVNERLSAPAQGRPQAL